MRSEVWSEKLFLQAHPQHSIIPANRSNFLEDITDSQSGYWRARWLMTHSRHPDNWRACPVVHNVSVTHQLSVCLFSVYRYRLLEDTVCLAHSWLRWHVRIYAPATVHPTTDYPPQSDAVTDGVNGHWSDRCAPLAVQHSCVTAVTSTLCNNTEAVPGDFDFQGHGTDLQDTNRWWLSCHERSIQPRLDSCSYRPKFLAQ